MNDLARMGGTPAVPDVAPDAMTGALAVQSREQAAVQMRYMMAKRFPRDELKAIDRITNAFARPALAERAAYEYARGGQTITGPSIHALQACAQGWGNISFGWRTLSVSVGADGVPTSEVEAYAEDLETTTGRNLVFPVRHWRDTRGGGYRIKDERDVYELVANMAARRMRACLEAVIPRDVIDTAMEQAASTMTAKADTSPEAMARMVEAFGAFEVTKEHIEKLIQRRLDAITPAQVVRLKRIYQSLRDGVGKAAEYFDIEPQATAPAPTTSSNVDNMKEVIAAKARAKTQAPTADEYAARMKAAKTQAQAEELLQDAYAHLSPDSVQQLADLYRAQFPQE